MDRSLILNVIESRLVPSIGVRQTGQPNYFLHVFRNFNRMEQAWRAIQEFEDDDLVFHPQQKRIEDSRMNEIHIFVSAQNLEAIRGVIISGYQLDGEYINNSLSSDMITMETLASAKQELLKAHHVK